MEDPIDQPYDGKTGILNTISCIFQESSSKDPVGHVSYSGSVNAFRIAGPVLSDWGTCDVQHVHFTARNKWVKDSWNPMLIGFYKDDIKQQ